MACQTKEYTTINGQERYDQINREDFKVDLKKFIDPKSNKIKFNLNAVIKLLPYNGFYPQQRTAQIAGIFNKVYLDSTGIVTDAYRVDACSSSSGDLSSGSQGVYATLAATQPLFAPGILFNTIKSGIAVDWPVSLATAPITANDFYTAWNYDYYCKEKVYSIKNIDARLRFETILEPDVYFSSVTSTSKSLFYLDPTHVSYLHFFDDTTTVKIPFISIDTISKMSTAQYKTIYKSAINNFLYETVNFFLKNNKLNSFVTKEFNANEIIPRDENKSYSMDIVIRKNPNFSMFNTVGYSGSDQYVPSGSLFGPPCSSSYMDNAAYSPYTPPYFTENGESKLTLILPSGSFGTTNTTLTAILSKVEFNKNINFPTTDVAQYNKMCLDSSLNLRQTENYDNKIKWYIQTKFETPLINFSKCSTIEKFEYTNILKDYNSCDS